MTKYPILLTILSATLFFCFGIASQFDDDLDLERIDVNLVVNIVDSTLILSNEDTLDFVDAYLELNNHNDTSLLYRKEWTMLNYSIESGEIDTILLSEFMENDSIPFPLDSIPIGFEFQAVTPEFHAIFFHRF